MRLHISSGARWSIGTLFGLTLLFASIGQTALAEYAYVVQEGDTIEDVAWNHGVMVSDIVELNGLANPDVIITGQTLLIPDYGDYSGVDAEATYSTGGGYASYVVESGDWYGYIANLFGVEIDALLAANGLSNDDMLHPGDELVIPYALPEDAPVAGGNPPPGPFTDRETIRWMLYDAAVEYGWDPYLIMSIAWYESGWTQDIISWADAYGVMQVLLDTASWAGPAIAGREVDVVNNTWDNIETGVAFLTHLRNEMGSDYLALCAYLQGMYSVQEDGIFPEAREYALDIISMRDLFASGELP
jgi:LysM repeat protein